MMLSSYRDDDAEGDTGAPSELPNRSPRRGGKLSILTNTPDKQTAEMVTSTKELEEERMVKEQIQESKIEDSLKVITEEEESEIISEVNELQNIESTCSITENSPEKSTKHILSDEVMVPEEGAQEQQIEEKMHLTLEAKEAKAEPDPTDVEEYTKEEKDIELPEELGVDNRGIEKSDTSKVERRESAHLGNIEESDLNKIEKVLSIQEIEEGAREQQIEEKMHLTLETKEAKAEPEPTGVEEYTKEEKDVKLLEEFGLDNRGIEKSDTSKVERGESAHLDNIEEPDLNKIEKVLSLQEIEEAAREQQIEEKMHLALETKEAKAEPEPTGVEEYTKEEKDVELPEEFGVDNRGIEKSDTSEVERGESAHLDNIEEPDLNKIEKVLSLQEIEEGAREQQIEEKMHLTLETKETKAEPEPTGVEEYTKEEKDVALPEEFGVDNRGIEKSDTSKVERGESAHLDNIEEPDLNKIEKVLSLQEIEEGAREQQIEEKMHLTLETKETKAEPEPTGVEEYTKEEKDVELPEEFGVDNRGIEKSDTSKVEGGESAHLDNIEEPDLNKIEKVLSLQEIEEGAWEQQVEEKMHLTLETKEAKAEPDPAGVEEYTKEEKDVELPEEFGVDNRGIEKSDTSKVERGESAHLDNIEEPDLNKIEKVLSIQEIEDYGPQCDTNIDNLKNTVETDNNAEEIFSEEQCQNTQDIVTSILDDVESATDFKNILSTEVGITNEIESALEQSESLPLVETEMEELNKLQQDSGDILRKGMEDTISNQNIDSLEGLLDLELMPEEEDVRLKTPKPEEEIQKSEQASKLVDMNILMQQSNDTVMAQDSDYITHVISSCLSDRNDAPLEDINTEKSDTMETETDKVKDAASNDVLKVHESIIPESMGKNCGTENYQKDLKEDSDITENDLVMDFGETPLESIAGLEETESKLELTSDILMQNVDQGENLNDAVSGVETSQASSEISELESAVKFLQESEEQAMDSPLVLSPKIVESVVDNISKETAVSNLFIPDDEDMCENTEDLETELQTIATDSISISEAEIISEAAKLENERKLAEQIKLDASKNKSKIDEDNQESNKGSNKEKVAAIESSEMKCDETHLQKIEVQKETNPEPEGIPHPIASLPQKILKTSESIPKVSILEERLKEPPKIEIPSTDISKIAMSATNTKDSLLIQKDAKLLTYQKMLESPKLSEKTEPKIMETPRKDSEKHDFENVGSPRIILKIAKSAIADCGEPRSPKSPKIRSATNSPNPEDSPGQKLGKIKLKLSKGGHPSIISNENIEETGQWYSEGSSSLSPLGMKIKFSKSGDASIVASEKYDTAEDSKETKHKFEESKRTESPIGMKIKLSKSGDASIVQDCKDLQMKHKDKLDMVQGSPKRTESPIGMKIKLSKTGDASIIQPERQDLLEEYKDNVQMKSKEKHEPCYDSPKRTDSPIGMKIKLSKTGDASIIPPDLPEESKESGKAKDKFDTSPEVPKRTESPIGMKIKLAKTKGGASIISVENSEEGKDKSEVADIPKRTESPLGMKIKLSKTGDASIFHSEMTDEMKEKSQDGQDGGKSSDPSCGMKIKVNRMGEVQTIIQESPEDSIENVQESTPKVESPLGVKIKFSKFGDASIVHSERQEQSEEGRSLPEIPKRTESPLGMKIKLSKSGDASIIQPETSEDAKKTGDGALGMKIKLLKTGDASIIDSEKKDKQQWRRDTENPLEMKIKLSKTGHPTIVACDNQAESGSKPKEDPSQNFSQRYKESSPGSYKESTLKILKAGHSTILQGNRSELTIEPVQMQGKKPDNAVEISPKRKDNAVPPFESKKTKLETQLNQILPEVTIQPVASREQKQFLFDAKNNSISLQQMNVINQEISITQVRPQKSTDPSMSKKLKDILSKNAPGPPLAVNSDCEIIEHRAELVIVNENSNSSQDVMIIEEVSPNRMPEVKVPKKRGRPRRNPLPPGITPPLPHMLMPRESLSLGDAQMMQQPQVPHFAETRENERPKRTCRSQKSYAPPKRGRGRGRGKRKMDSTDPHIPKKPRIEQDLTAIVASTTGIISLDAPTIQQESFGKSPELYKALKQPTMDANIVNASGKVCKRTVRQKKYRTKNAAVINNTIPNFMEAQSEMGKMPEMRLPKPISTDSRDGIKDKKLGDIVAERAQKGVAKDEKGVENVKLENKDMLIPPGHPNWLTPVSKRGAEGATKQENVSTVQVIDEETRMSAESSSRSQTPARNIPVPASETLVNEESQGSVLSTATTESEKVKVKNRRMEINFDPDEGPFTVDKIAEYEWPLDRKGETFMIQEQISQYLGVKSFKRKYPDLKRRVVDMEERNYLRENGLVSEAMCDMGLTAVCSSEVLDVMCSDFPDQYEEYRKHMREKQVKEHSKKQKELTAAANAEKNRIDLAEMAVQSALSWNVNLNKARRENRKCSLDLQTFTIHVPKKQQKVETERRIGHFPVALIPGQYTDYYREYTPAELRYYPLNIVLYGPMRPNERKFDSQSEGSQSDSDSDSSSDDSSSSSSEGTQDTEGSQSTMDDVDMEIANQKDEIKLKCKMCLKSLNKHSKNEVLIQCGTCNGHVHPSCIDLTLDMVPHIQSYAWQCTDCKTCAQCHDPADEDKMLFCDMCDRGYHIYCVGLRRVPQGRWHCQECAVCANCGSREPGGVNSDRNSVAQWQHEYKKGDKNTRVYVSTLCVPCSKLRGDQGGTFRQEKLPV